MDDPTLNTVLRNINAARLRGTPDLALLKEYARNKPVMRMLDRVETRLVVYGSLAPGEVNYDELATLSGQWQRAKVRGRLASQGWGEHVGFPGITWDPDANPIDAQLFTSTELPAHWSRLDAFEGNDYQRILIPAEVSTGLVVANIYEVVSPGN